MASEPKKPKGILKKPKAGGAPNPPTSRAEAERIALQHARIIEQQKEVEADVFKAIETLTDFPLVRDAAGGVSSSHPAPSDVARFKQLVRLFQPGDYDNLIEERNIQGACGYALCPAARRRFAGGGEFKFVNKNRADFGIVRREELEQWCCDECARRALYIKVQLNETPAWERIGLPDLPIELLGEDQHVGGSGSGPVADVARGVSRLQLEQDRKIAAESAALALERGDDGKPRPGRKIDVAIREKRVIAEAKPPEIESDTQDQDTHLILDGHKTRFGTGDQSSTE